MNVKCPICELESDNHYDFLSDEDGDYYFKCPRCGCESQRWK
jgi:endogenous inhibitor of DNA gyrase (YacG/DUF329 family)